MDQQSKEKTLENLTKAENILIAVSDTTGVDGLASGLALYLAFQKLGKNTSIMAKSPSVGDAMMLYGVDAIGKLTGKTNLVVVVDNALDNVDKVTYFLEGDRLKILIHPLPGSKGISQDQLKFEQTVAKPGLIISIGFSSIEELIKVITQEQNIDSDVWIISISKEELSPKFAQANVFNPQSATLSEISTQFIQELALPVDEDIAYNLFAGISAGTNNFSPAKASTTSFQMAAWLIKFGAGKASLADESIRHSFSQLGSPQTAEPDLDQSFTQIPRITVPPAFDTTPFATKPIEGVEPEKISEKDWLKPPKIYKGSKSFDREN